MRIGSSKKKLKERRRKNSREFTIILCCCLSAASVPRKEVVFLAEIVRPGGQIVRQQLPEAREQDLPVVLAGIDRNRARYSCGQKHLAPSSFSRDVLARCVWVCVCVCVCSCVTDRNRFPPAGSVSVCVARGNINTNINIQTQTNIRKKVSPQPEL